MNFARRISRARSQNLTSGLFSLCLQPLFDPFASAMGKVLSDRFSEVIGMLASRVAEEANLFSVAATPFAEEEVHPQTNSLDQRQFSVESL